MRAEYRRDLKNNYLVIEAEEKEEDEDYCIHMVEQNKIPGLLPFHRSRKDGKLFLNYEITGRQAVSSLFEKRYLGYTDILFLLSGISGHLDTLSRYLLSPEKLIFDPQYIFTEPERRGIWLCYAPGVEQEASVTLLAEFILKRLNHEDSGAVALGYRFYAKTQEENFSLSAALRELLLEYRAGIQDQADMGAETAESGSGQEGQYGVGRTGSPSSGAWYGAGKSQGLSKSAHCGTRRAGDSPPDARHTPEEEQRAGFGQRGWEEQRAGSGQRGRQEQGTGSGQEQEAGFGQRGWQGQGAGSGQRDWEEQGAGSGRRGREEQGAGSGQRGREEQGAGSGQRGWQGQGADAGQRGWQGREAGSGQRGRQEQRDQDSVWKEYEVIHKSRSERGDMASGKLRQNGGKSDEPRLTDRIFRVVHPAVLLSALFLIAASEAAFYFGYLEVTEAGGVFFLILSAELLANSYWRRAKERKEQEQYEGWDDEEEEDEEYLRLQAEMYENSHAGRPEREEIGETRCLTEDEEGSGMRLIYVPAYGSLKESTADFPDIVVGADTVTVGKLPGACEIVLRAQTVSRLHARLGHRQGKYFLEDLNSRNGTFLNGERLNPQEIREFSGGDRIAFADIQYRAVCL